MPRRIRAVSLLVVSTVLTACAVNTHTTVSGADRNIPAKRFLIPVDESRSVTLFGNVHPLARAEFDQGMTYSDKQLNRMLLVLEPSAAKQAALDTLVAEQQDPGSLLYHQWLSPAEFGARFGADDSALAQVIAWLTVHGFTIEEIPARPPP